MNEFSQLIKTSKTDEYYTPRYAVEIIVPFLKLKKYKTVWCPFDKKNSEFVKILQENNFDVIYGHIDTGEDFFGYDTPPEKVDCIVSNPPFSKRNSLFNKLFSFKVPFAMIMNLNGLFDAKNRYEIFKNNDFELLIPSGRMSFFDENMLIQNKPNFQSVYVCNGVLNKTIEFVEMTK